MDKLRTSLASVAESLLGEMGVYLPKLIGALLILIFGWLAAYLISRLVRAALRRTTIDNRIVSWVRGEEGETPDIEPMVGKIVFWFVMIFVFIAFFNALQLAAVTEPLQNMVESILEPSRVISDQYNSMVITLNDGTVINGRIINLSNHDLRVNTDMTNPAAITKVDRRKVKSMEESSVSIMPPGLLNTLNQDEILDLLAYLLSSGDPDDPLFK